MTRVWWMIGVAAGSCGVAALIVPEHSRTELVLGMLGPLCSAVVTWVVTAHTHETARERMTGVMVAGFAARMVFFGAYVAVMLRVLTLSPVPFVISFTSYFIAMYAMEAVFLKRLLDPGTPARSHP
jgi:hypothetical protein